MLCACAKPRSESVEFVICYRKTQYSFRARHGMMLSMSKRMRAVKVPTRVQTSSRRRQVKQRKTFTLSPQSVAFLEELSAERSARGQESVSAVLDDLLMSFGEEKRRREMEHSTQKYYDMRSPQDEEEEIAWAKFALSQFPVWEGPKGETK